MTVRSATLPPRTALLSGASVVTQQASCYPIALMDDGETLAIRNVNRIGVSSDYGATCTLGEIFDEFDGFNSSVDGFLETPDGEVLISLRRSDDGEAGVLMRSTGWNPATADATSWTRVLTATGVGSYFRGQWGLNQGCIAPSWSKHAGAIFIVEYGLPKPTAYRAYMSTDDGVTWTEIFDLTDHNEDSNVHCHGITYDPWRGGVYISIGDTGNAIYYSENPEAASPTWTVVEGSESDSSGTHQATTLRAVEAGLIALADGLPHSIYLYPRRTGSTAVGPPKAIARFRGDTPTAFGATLWRNGGYEDPQPTAPIFACINEAPTALAGLYPGIYVSQDGGCSWTLAYRHTSATDATGRVGIDSVWGPDINGKVIARINIDGTYKVVTLDYLPDAKKLVPELPWTRLHTGQNNFSAVAAAAGALYEGGYGSIAGTGGSRLGFYFDPADHAVGGRTKVRMKLRLDGGVGTTAPTVNFTAEIKPATVSGNGAVTAGATVTGSLITITTPAAGADIGALPGSEVEFDAPTEAGYYIVYVTNGTMAGSSIVNLRSTVSARGV